MKDLSNVEIAKGEIVYYFEPKTGDFEFGMVLTVGEDWAYVSALKMTEDEEGKQLLQQLNYNTRYESQMIYILPGASQRIPVRETEQSAEAPV